LFCKIYFFFDFLYLKNEFRAKNKFPPVTRRCRRWRRFLNEI
jgi:hypothetical protein